MKNIQYIFLALSLFSCDANEFFNIPSEQGNGSYDYDSSSVYYDDRGDESERGINRGSFEIVTLGSESTLNIYPRLGWSYQITIDNMQDHTLADASVVTSFRIQRSSQYISNSYSSGDDEFRLDGTTNIMLEDSDGSTIGQFDGLIRPNGEMEFEYESVNIRSGEYVITTINGFEVE